MSRPLRLLIVEDSENDTLLVVRELEREGYDVAVERVETEEGLRAALGGSRWDLVVADYSMPRFSGTRAFRVIKELGLDLPFILVSGTVGEENAVEAMKLGVHDYIMKGNLKRLVPAVERELREVVVRQERKRAQEALAKKVEQLARSNAELERFAHVASHDLKEPLRMVAAYTQLLARRYRGKLDQEADEMIQFAVEGANRVYELIDALLAFSRIDQAWKGLVTVDMEGALARALDDLRLPIQETGAIITNDPLPAALADRIQMEQLLQNLIGNAIKFRGPSPPMIHASAEPRGAEWVFSIRDNGIGIDPRYSERVFIIFQRLHERERYPGTGIGLAISKKIVERHGGRIWVESRAGQRATFYFTIPIQCKGEAPSA